MFNVPVHLIGGGVLLMLWMCHLQSETVGKVGKSLGQVSKDEWEKMERKRHSGRHRKEGAGAIGRIYWKKME